MNAIWFLSFRAIAFYVDWAFLPVPREVIQIEFSIWVFGLKFTIFSAQKFLLVIIKSPFCPLYLVSFFKGPLQSPFDVLLLSSPFLEVELSRTSSFRIPNRQNCAKRRTTRNFGLCWSFFEAYFCFAISHSLKQNKAPSVLHLSFGTWQEAPWYYKEHTAELLMKTLQ